MKKTILLGLLLAGVGTAAALAGPIEDRQAVMKQFNDASRILGGMARGTAPYDATTAKAQLQILSDGAAKLGGAFPAGSDKSDDPAVKTLALPTVWSDSAGFQAAAAKFAADVKTAQATSDQAGFTAAFQTVQADCGACHRTYRAPLPNAGGRGGAGGGGQGGGAGAPPAPAQ
jgi:cytochrome c556